MPRELTDVLKDLEAPLDGGVVKKTEYGSFDYVDAFYAINEANQVFGGDGWSHTVMSPPVLIREYVRPAKNKGTNRVMVFQAVVRVTAIGTHHDGVGVGKADGPDDSAGYADLIDKAMKEAETDAMKRALRIFGYRFGLALYDKEQKNVDRSGSEGKQQRGAVQSDDASGGDGQPSKAAITAWQGKAAKAETLPALQAVWDVAPEPVRKQLQKFFTARKGVLEGGGGAEGAAPAAKTTETPGKPATEKATSKPAAPGAGATGKDELRDPAVHKDPDGWEGASFQGARLSACPADYLTALAKHLESLATIKTDKGNAVGARYDRNDAKAALAWAARKQQAA